MSNPSKNYVYRKAKMIYKLEKEYYDEYHNDNNMEAPPVGKEFKCSQQVRADEKFAWNSDDE